MTHRSLFSLLLLSLILAGCGRSPQPQPPTAPATAVADASTPAAPTATVPVEETAVPDDLPTATAVPTLTPVPTSTHVPTATPTPEPVFLLSREDFGPDRNPFTGELVEDAAVLQRRPIACKISNHPPKYTRPQSGLNDADLVFEHVNQWTLTRFTAIFYSKAPPDIGPIRSYRLFDLEILPMYDAVLCTSGSNQGVMDRFYATDFRGSIINTSEDGYYRKEIDKPFEHTFYADPLGLWRALEGRDKNRAPELRNFMPFTTDPPPGGQPATHITLDYIEEIAEWEYQPENGRYWRWSDGEPHIDANDGEQLNFANVVAVFAVHESVESICAEVVDGRCIAKSIEIFLQDEGRAIVFRDGLMVEGEWRRDHQRDMLTFYDEAGDPIPLQIGNTMFQVVTTHRNNQIEVEP